jgi:hypothetical protein
MSVQLTASKPDSPASTMVGRSGMAEIGIVELTPSARISTAALSAFIRASSSGGRDQLHDLLHIFYHALKFPARQIELSVGSGPVRSFALLLIAGWKRRLTAASATRASIANLPLTLGARG